MTYPFERIKKEYSKYKVIENLFLNQYLWKVIGMEQSTTSYVYAKCLIEIEVSVSRKIGFSPTNCFYLNNKRPRGEHKVSIYKEISKTDYFVVKLTGKEKSVEIGPEAHEQKRMGKD